MNFIDRLVAFKTDNGYKSLNQMLEIFKNIQTLIQDLTLKEEETFLTTVEENLLDILLEQEKELKQIIHE